MLKKFFTVFLGSMAAIWLSIILFAVIIVIGVAMWLASSGDLEIKSNSILYINMSGQMTDRYVPVTFEDKMMGYVTDGQALDEIIAALKQAKTDSRIKGVYLDMRGSDTSMAMRQEMRAALADFKTSGKWVYAYADTYSQGDYYSAAIADSIFINPSGNVDIHGLAVSVPFFKNGLDKLGVDIQVLKVGTFKSAVEPYILTKMSEPARLQYQVLLDTTWQAYTRDVVADLHMPADSASMISRLAAVPMLSYRAPHLVSLGLVDRAAYRYEVEQMLRRKAGSGDDLNLVSPHRYVATDIVDLVGREEKVNQAHIAVVYAVGDIIDSGSTGIVGEKMAPMIVKLADDDNVKGLLLRVNSGGGSAFASEQIWASLQYFKSKGKPFYVSMGSMAASGGYYISCGADKIYADETTLTGSIGIFAIIPYAQTLLNDKLGVNIDVVETNPNTVVGRPDAPLTSAQHAALQTSVNDGYDLFVSRVAQGRKLSDERVREIAEGRVWVGASAKQIGLVDVLGGQALALADLCQQTGLSASQTIDYPYIEPDVFEVVDKLLGDDDVADDDSAQTNSRTVHLLRTLNVATTQVQQYIDILARITSMGNVQAKAEDITIK